MVEYVIYSAISFLIGYLSAPHILLYVRKNCVLGESKKDSLFGGKEAKVRNSIHKVAETVIPRMGGLIFLAPVLITSAILFYLNEVTIDYGLLLFIWMIGITFGIILDINILQKKEIRLRYRILFVGAVSSLIGYIYYSLGLVSLFIPFLGNVFLGKWIILIFILVFMSLYASCIIDGIDSLASVVFGTIIAAYSVMGIIYGSYEVLIFGFVIIGSILAYLRYNFHPARWYYGETGIMAIVFATGGMVFLVESLGAPAIVALPLIGLMLVITVGSVILQGLSKKYCGKKIWSSTPIHHHFETIAPSQTVVLIYFIITLIISGAVLISIL